MTPELQPTIDLIVAGRRVTPAERAALVAISGIDASDKGYLTAQIAAILDRQRLRVANINIDGWLNLPTVRFNDTNPAEHFYLHAIRFDEMFADLIFPLRDHRSIRLEMDYAEETATSYRKPALRIHRHRHRFAQRHLSLEAIVSAILRPVVLD